MQRKIRVIKKLKIAVVALALFCASGNTFGQSVGVNTNNPDPSASLEVAGNNKGLLIPRISLQSLTDNTTIPNPATALLIYNTNAGLGKAGFYYNSGTADNPAWSLVGAGASTLTLPFSQLGTNNGPLFLINNNDASSGTIAISGIAANAVGIRGATLSGTGLIGHTASGGKGVTASAANTNGTALEVNGRMQIHGPGQTVGAGKVLTSDANGFATWEILGGNVAFSASGVLGGGNGNIPAAASPSKLAFANQNYDLSLNYNDANQSPHSAFIVPFNGIYHFDLAVNWNHPSQGTFRSTLFLNMIRGGNFSTIASDQRYSKESGSNSLSIDVSLLAGDIIEVGVHNNPNETSSTLQISSARFNGRLLTKQ